MNNGSGSKPKKTPAKKKRQSRRKLTNDKDKQTELDGNKRENQDKKTGRFLPGNKAAEGKGGTRSKMKWNNEFRNCATSEDIRACYNKLKEMALDGDLVAMGMLLDRLLGKPDTHTDITLEHSMDFNIDETFL